MKSKQWPILAASVIACAGLMLTGCTGGGGGEPVPPAPPMGKLNADNALDASGVASLALMRVQADAAGLIGAALSNYIEQPAADSYPCAQGGRLTLSRPSTTTWRYTVDNCNTGGWVLRSGELQIDAGVPDVGLRFSFKDLNYVNGSEPARPMQAVSGRLDSNIPVTADLGRRSAGDMSFTSNARTDEYLEVYIANKTSDPNFLQYGFKVRSPRFAHEFRVVYDDTSKTVTLQADDGSVLSVVALGASGARLELRTSTSTAPTWTRVVTAAELQSAMSRALQ